MRVCVVGLGYIGLPTAALLATKGFRVAGMDIDEARVAAINRGDVASAEPDLDLLVKSAVQSGNLTASIQVSSADTFIIAVPTPLQADQVPDASAVEAATAAIAPYLEPGSLVILESTCPVGTTDRLAARFHEARPDLDVPRSSSRDESLDERRRIFVAHSPERVLPGQILRELVDNDRVVGGVDRASGERTRDFYGMFVNSDIVVTDLRGTGANVVATRPVQEVAGG